MASVDRESQPVSGRGSNQYRQQPPGFSPASRSDQLLAQVAARPFVPPPLPAHLAPLARRLSLLPQHRQRQIAGRQETPPAVMQALAAVVDDYSVQLAIAENPQCTPEVLRQLAAYPQVAAWNRDNTPGDLLLWALQRGVIGQTNAAMKRYLGSDGMIWIAQHHTDSQSDIVAGEYLAKRLDLCPPAALILARSPDMVARLALAENPMATPQALRLLISDPDRRVAQAAADNPSLPEPMLALWQLAH
jgi:hypothetical protein